MSDVQCVAAIRAGAASARACLLCSIGRVDMLSTVARQVAGGLKLLAWCLLGCVVASNEVCAALQLRIPEIREASHKRLVTLADIEGLRVVDTLSVSRDGRRFAVFVRQGNPETNSYRTAWFVGDVSRGSLTYVGDGGIVTPSFLSNGQQAGDVQGSDSQWSPNGEWIAYTLQRDGEVQLWRSRADGSAQQQISDTAADVEDFAWSEDGQEIYATVGEPRAERRARQELKAREGYQYDEDLNALTDLLQAEVRSSPKGRSTILVVSPSDHRVRSATSAEQDAFARVRDSRAMMPALAGASLDARVSPMAHKPGVSVWLEKIGSSGRNRGVVASIESLGANPIRCPVRECQGSIARAWLSQRSDTVLFWRHEGSSGESFGRSHGFYAWVPKTGEVKEVVSAIEDDLQLCSLVTDDRLICVRETPSRPSHLALVDLRRGTINVLVDLNPEFRNIRLGRVERFEWALPKFEWNAPSGELAGLYGKSTFGYILYPPDFDPLKRYPVFIEPYIAVGFNHPLHAEHPLQVYAASGFVVLSLTFPDESIDALERMGSAVMKELYSRELDYPLLSMYTESTLLGLDAVAARGFIDERRVGIGGISHGTFVPLYLLQKHHRIAAVSISSPNWGPLTYYIGTRKLRETMYGRNSELGFEDWQPRPEGEGRKFWSDIDIADHVDAIEAPILMHFSDQEAVLMLRLIRHMADCAKPYDAYIFPHETHVKWQPAHLHSIMGRNLDWFRFWLQDLENPDPSKAGQYQRWRQLKAQHYAGSARSRVDTEQ